MKILELNLLAFGPFSNVLLDLTGGQEGLHVIYGANEAGKSSALRALRALLFGIPHYTADNFRHDGPSLRIGGRLRHSNGSEISFLRRKGKQRTLLNYAGGPRQDSDLDLYLGGVNDHIFTSLFGISHSVLVSGGQELLQGKGEAGQSFFAAGLGTTTLAAFLKEIDQEQRNLFLPSGQKPVINQAINKYREAKSAIDKYALPSREWAVHHKAFKTAENRKAELTGELLRLGKESAILERFEKALPKIARLKGLKKSLGEMGPVAVLRPEFSRERREAANTLKNARDNCDTAANDLRELEERVSGLEIPESLLEQSDQINALYERKGVYLQGRKEKPGLEGSLSQLRLDAESLLADLRPDLTLEQVQTIRLKAPERLEILELGNQHQNLVSTLNRVERDWANSQKNLGAKKQALEDLPPECDAGELRVAVENCLRKGNLEERAAQLQREINNAEKQLEVDFKKFRLYNGAREDLESLPVPDNESIDFFDTELARQENEVTRRQGKISEIGGDLDNLEQQLETLRLAGEVPGEADLTQAREQRRLGWQLVRRSWLNQEDVSEEAKTFDSERDLPEAFEKQIEITDQIADRLRREADRVASRAALTVALQKNQELLVQWQDKEKNAREELNHIQNSWQELWTPCGISPLSPREMRSWLSSQKNLAENVETLRKMRQEADMLQEEITAHKNQLWEATAPLREEIFDSGGSLESMMVKSQRLLDELKELSLKRITLHNDIATLQEQIEHTGKIRQEAADNLQDWQRQWSKAVKPLGLTGETSPTAANLVINKMEELFRNLSQSASVNNQLAAIERNAEQFKIDVNELMVRSGPDLAGLPPEQIAGTLHDRVVKAQTDAALRDSLENQIKGKRAYLEKNRQSMATATNRLTELCREAGCDDFLKLEELENLSDGFQALHTNLGLLQDQILEYAGGASLEEFISEAENFSIDELPGRINENTHKIEELESERSVLDQTIGEERTELAKMDGNARAAAEAEKMHDILATMRLDVEHYIRLKLAGLILHREIKRYREANEGALISRAAELFHTLTCGSFTSVGIDYNENDEAILKGVRTSGERLGVEKMSEGTVDQLYLALRLAILEHYLKNHEPMPFIVDDILIKFDDDRAEATLKVLSHLSQKTQVIFFTHHRRLVEIADDLRDDNIVIHRLHAL